MLVNRKQRSFLILRDTYHRTEFVDNISNVVTRMEHKVARSIGHARAETTGENIWLKCDGSSVTIVEKLANEILARVGNEDRLDACEWWSHHCCRNDWHLRASLQPPPCLCHPLDHSYCECPFSHSRRRHFRNSDVALTPEVVPRTSKGELKSFPMIAKRQCKSVVAFCEEEQACKMGYEMAGFMTSAFWTSWKKFKTQRAFCTFHRIGLGISKRTRRFDFEFVTVRTPNWPILFKMRLF